MTRKRLYRVFEPMVQYAVFEAYATSKAEALRMVMESEGEPVFAYANDPIPDTVRAPQVELWRDLAGNIQYEPTEQE